MIHPDGIGKKAYAKFTVKRNKRIILCDRKSNLKCIQEYY